MLKQHWAPFCHLLGNISACWSPIYSKKRSCNRSAGGDMVWITCWVCLATIMVVLHVRLCPLCKMVFSSTLTVIRCISFWYKPIGCTLHATCCFSFLWKFPQFCVQFTAWVLGLQFRFRLRLMVRLVLRVKFRG